MENFRLTYIVSSMLMYTVGLLTLISFTSPYWVTTNSDRDAEFTNLGLWEVCFNDYKNVQSTGNKYFDGCKAMHSKEMIRLRRWFLPDWLKLVQILSISNFIDTFAILFCILIGLFTRLRDMFIFITSITILIIALDALNILILLLFGINTYIHEWTPEKAYTDNIHFSFSFWSQFAAAGLSFIATLLFLSESRIVLNQHHVKQSKFEEYDTKTLI